MNSLESILLQMANIAPSNSCIQDLLDLSMDMRKLTPRSAAANSLSILPEEEKSVLGLTNSRFDESMLPSPPEAGLALAQTRGSAASVSNVWDMVSHPKVLEAFVCVLYKGYNLSKNSSPGAKGRKLVDSQTEEVTCCCQDSQWMVTEPASEEKTRGSVYSMSSAMTTRRAHTECVLHFVTAFVRSDGIKFLLRMLNVMEHDSILEWVVKVAWRIYSIRDFLGRCTGKFSFVSGFRDDLGLRVSTSRESESESGFRKSWFGTPSNKSKSRRKSIDSVGSKLAKAPSKKESTITNEGSSLDDIWSQVVQRLMERPVVPEQIPLTFFEILVESIRLPRRVREDLFYAKLLDDRKNFLLPTLLCDFKTYSFTGCKALLENLNVLCLNCDRNVEEFASMKETIPALVAFTMNDVSSTRIIGTLTFDMCLELFKYSLNLLSMVIMQHMKSKRESGSFKQVLKSVRKEILKLCNASWNALAAGVYRTFLFTVLKRVQSEVHAMKTNMASAFWKNVAELFEVIDKFLLYDPLSSDGSMGFQTIALHLREDGSSEDLIVVLEALHLLEDKIEPALANLRGGNPFARETVEDTLSVQFDRDKRFYLAVLKFFIILESSTVSEQDAIILSSLSKYIRKRFPEKRLQYMILKVSQNGVKGQLAKASSRDRLSTTTKQKEKDEDLYDQTVSFMNFRKESSAFRFLSEQSTCSDYFCALKRKAAFEESKILKRQIAETRAFYEGREEPANELSQSMTGRTFATVDSKSRFEEKELSVRQILNEDDEDVCFVEISSLMLQRKAVDSLDPSLVDLRNIDLPRRFTIRPSLSMELSLASPHAAQLHVERKSPIHANIDEDEEEPSSIVHKDVEALQSQRAPSPGGIVPIDRMMVLESFEATEAGQISVKKGDIVDVIRIREDGFAYCDAGVHVGYVPKRLLRKMSQSEQKRNGPDVDSSDEEQMERDIHDAVALKDLEEVPTSLQ
eukprot:TRINITY_DN2947_c0_g1_i1.p1 TRINITY_DN2947_c0_g1~~TRINITY_DN2947_c0_g1_i1.p1  ORF type:complete len:1029 (-),score=245.97 TRINITY_DN2947_c0_g1_i1:1105-4011(-)